MRTHGKISTYKAGCRCSACVDVRRQYMAEYQRKHPSCEVEGCGRPARRRYCEAHDQRLRKYGDFGEAPVRSRKSPEYGAVPTYFSSHAKLTRIRGAARDQVCVVCREQAYNWALIHGTLDVIPAGIASGRSHGPYSLNVDAYQPMCAKCHKRYDMAVKKKA